MTQLMDLPKEMLLEIVKKLDHWQDMRNFSQTNRTLFYLIRGQTKRRFNTQKPKFSVMIRSYAKDVTDISTFNTFFDHGSTHIVCLPIPPENSITIEQLPEELQSTMKHSWRRKYIADLTYNVEETVLEMHSDILQSIMVDQLHYHTELELFNIKFAERVFEEKWRHGLARIVLSGGPSSTDLQKSQDIYLELFCLFVLRVYDEKRHRCFGTFLLSVGDNYRNPEKDHRPPLAHGETDFLTSSRYLTFWFEKMCNKIDEPCTTRINPKTIGYQRQVLLLINETGCFELNISVN